MSTDPLPHEEDYHGLITPRIKAALILPNAVLEQISTEEKIIIIVYLWIL
jgi:hypothetical protein